MKTKPAKTFAIYYHDAYIGVEVWGDDDDLRAHLKSLGHIDADNTDTIAYAAPEPKETSPKDHGKIYFCESYLTIDTVAHEAVHLALGLIRRIDGVTEIAAGWDDALPAEERFCDIVGTLVRLMCNELGMR